jgi:hypothetical protein
MLLSPPPRANARKHRFFSKSGCFLCAAARRPLKNFFFFFQKNPLYRPAAAVPTRLRRPKNHLPVEYRVTSNRNMEHLLRDRKSIRNFVHCGATGNPVRLPNVVRRNANRQVWFTKKRAVLAILG